MGVSENVLENEGGNIDFIWAKQLGLMRLLAHEKGTAVKNHREHL